MGRFDATQGAQIEQTIENTVERPEIGRVVEVFEHVKDDDKSNFELDIELLEKRSKQLRAVSWQSVHNDEVKVPKTGDKVIVEYRGKSKKTPIARNAIFTNVDRPPKAVAGMWRKKVQSGSSPAGGGDLYIESYTEYETDPGSVDFDPENTTEQNAYVRIAKKNDDLDSSTHGTSLPMSIEMVDDPENGEAYITAEMNVRNGIDQSNSWGMKIDANTGEFKLLDADGYGIVSDGSGNFTWHYETIDHSQGTTTEL